eukprot:15350181-Ditylum_brightwellii.AAC.4
MDGPVMYEPDGVLMNASKLDDKFHEELIKNSQRSKVHSRIAYQTGKQWEIAGGSQNRHLTLRWYFGNDAQFL